MTGSSLRIVPVEPGDIDALTDVMTRAFDDDAQRHLGVERGGPPGYDTGEFLRRYGFDPGAGAFQAVLGGEPVGAVIAFPGDDGHHVLGCIFSDPGVQRRGIGSALFRFVEARYPGRSWTLETPAFAESNHRFYTEKIGLLKVDERDDPGGAGRLFVFRKVTGMARDVAV